MVKTYFRPKNAREALDLLAREKNAVLLAGGTYLMTSQFAERPMAAIAISGIAPRGIERRGDTIAIGAGATFQDIVDSALLPEALRRAALGMADRNIRNRATAGGNIGADKSCASLVPFFLAAEARYDRFEAQPISAADWQQTAHQAAGGAATQTGPAEDEGPLSAAGRGFIARIEFEAPPARRFAYGKYSRTSCDLALLTCAVSAEMEGPAPRNLRIAMGGLSPHARRFPELETLFEGRGLPSKAEIEATAAPLFSPMDDFRGSASFKRLRAAVLLADALSALEANS